MMSENLWAQRTNEGGAIYARRILTIYKNTHFMKQLPQNMGI